MINLMLGGPLAQLPVDWAKEPGDWAGVDRGATRLLNAGITPLWTIGDFDSSTKSEKERVKKAVGDFVQVPSEKDFTDTELGLLTAFEKGADYVRLFGATGGRLDHLLSNLFLPLQPDLAPHIRQFELVDKNNVVRFFPAGTHEILPRTGYPYLGIVNLVSIAHLTISGAKYPLKDWSHDTPMSWGSNEFVDGQPVTVSFSSGVVAVIDSKDSRGQKVDN